MHTRWPASWLFIVLAAAGTMRIAVASEEPSEDAARDLSQQFAEAYRGKDYARAIEVGTRLAALRPKDYELAYNIGCAAALQGSRDDAITWLRRSAELGMAQVELITSDDDLASIRTDTELNPIIDLVKKNRAAAFEELKKRVDATPPKIVVPDSLNAGKPATLLVVLHGYGDREDIIAERYRDVAEEIGAIIVSLRAPHALSDGGYHWGDVEDADYVITSGIEQVSKSHRIAADRIILSGFSQGGFMALNVGMRHPDKFRGIIPIAGHYAEQLAKPTGAVSDPKPRVYLIVGSEDRVVESNRKAVTDFEAAGLKVALRVIDGVGHVYPPNRAEELRKALQFVLAE